LRARLPNLHVVGLLDDDLRVTAIAVDRVDEGLVLNVLVRGKDLRVLGDGRGETRLLLEQARNALDLRLRGGLPALEALHLLDELASSRERGVEQKHHARDREDAPADHDSDLLFIVDPHGDLLPPYVLESGAGGSARGLRSSRTVKRMLFGSRNSGSCTFFHSGRLMLTKSE